MRTHRAPQQVGLAGTRPEQPATMYSTAIGGNSRVGHECGTALGEQDRASFLECLKNLWEWL